MNTEAWNGAAYPPAAAGVVVPVVGPGGSGKSTLIDEALRRMGYPDLPPGRPQAVTCTTRARRPGEVDGVHYHYLTREEFLRQVEAGEFLEYDRVVKRTPDGSVLDEYLVGLRRRDLDAVLQRHGFAVMAMTMPGTEAIRRTYPDTRVVLVIVADPETVVRRMERRGTSRADARARAAYDAHFFERPPAADLVIQNEDGAQEDAARILAAFLGACAGQK